MAYWLAKNRQEVNVVRTTAERSGTAEFHRDLRTEIAAGQARRHGFVTAKLAFVVTLLGFGTAASVTKVGEDASALLYLVPFVTFVFDLYIIGEDFGIKRAGSFLRISSEVESERTWEQAVSEYRDRFAQAAGLLSSSLSLVAASAGLLAADRKEFLIPWLAIGLSLVAITATHRAVQEIPLKRFRSFVAQHRPEPPSPSAPAQIEEAPT